MRNARVYLGVSVDGTRRHGASQLWDADLPSRLMMGTASGIRLDNPGQRIDRPMIGPPPPDKRATWRRMTLGEAAESGDLIAVWRNNKACGWWLEHGQQYRATLTAADLAGYAERYGKAATFEDFRSRLRCRHCGSGDVSTIVDKPVPAGALGEVSDMRWLACIALSFMVFCGLTGCSITYDDLIRPEQRWQPGTN
jgi:hypothetical protein